MPHCALTQIPIKPGEKQTIVVIRQQAMSSEETPSSIFSQTVQLRVGCHSHLAWEASAEGGPCVRVFFRYRSWAWLVQKFGYKFKGTAEMQRFQHMLNASELYAQERVQDDAFEWHVVLWAMYQVSGRSVFNGDVLHTPETDDQLREALTEQRVLLEFALNEVHKELERLTESERK